MTQTPLDCDIQIVVAIPTLNEAHSIERVIRALASEKNSLPNLSIVVADGGSTDETTRIVERLAAEMPFVSLVNNPKRWQSAAVNSVAKLWDGKADLLVRCDAHAIYPQKFLQNLLSSLDRTGADSIVVPMDSVGKGCLQKAVAWVSDTAIGSGGSAHRGGRKSGFVDHGHHAMFKMASFRRVGGYDETFFCNEDAEFDCRLKSIGGLVFLDADIRIKYFPRNRLVSLWRQYFNYGLGRAKTMKLHPDSIRARQAAVPLHLMISVLSIAIFMATLRWEFLAWPAFYLFILAIAALSLAFRHASLCAIWAAPAALVMHSAWGLGFFSGVLSVKKSS
jgi:succinoglycan biosynthesis protein ExoA